MAQRVSSMAQSTAPPGPLMSEHRRTACQSRQGFLDEGLPASRFRLGVEGEGFGPAGAATCRLAPDRVMSMGQYDVQEGAHPEIRGSAPG
jgi:hypothetical protein